MSILIVTSRVTITMRIPKLHTLSNAFQGRFHTIKCGFRWLVGAFSLHGMALATAPHFELSPFSIRL